MPGQVPCIPQAFFTEKERFGGTILCTKEGEYTLAKRQVSMLMVSGKTSVIKPRSGQGVKGTHPPHGGLPAAGGLAHCQAPKDPTPEAQFSFLLLSKAEGWREGRVNGKKQSSNHPNRSSFG